MKTPVLLVASAFALLTSTGALAHPQGGGGLLAGFAHPFSGLDHVLAMMMLGLWAARRRGTTRLLLPFSFIASLLLGGFMGLVGLHVPAAEALIACSVLVFAFAVAASPHLGLRVGLALAAGFGLFHGYVHMGEMPASAEVEAFTAGMVAGSAVLHALGLGLGTLVAMHRPAFQP